jgi:plasmid stability protein
MCYHNDSMPNLLVRDIPEDVHARLQRRAERSGQSLQQFLARELCRIAERPSIDEVLDRIERRRGGKVGLGQAAEDLGEERVDRR